MQQLVGFGLAVLAALGYEFAYLIQARAARSRRDDRLRVRLALDLVRNRRWLAGTGLVGVAAGLHVAALVLAPLTVVQPTIALGLIVLLLAARPALGERPGAREYAAVAGIVVGVSACALAAPDIEVRHNSGRSVAPLLGLLGIALALPFALRARLGDPRVRVLAAGAGDALAAFAFKLAADAIATGLWLASVAWLVLAAAAAALAVTAEMSALQRLSATRVGPAIVALQVAVPVGAAPLFLGESWSATPFGGALVAGAVLTVLAAAGVLGASRPQATGH